LFAPFSFFEGSHAAVASVCLIWTPLFLPNYNANLICLSHMPWPARAAPVACCSASVSKVFFVGGLLFAVGSLPHCDFDNLCCRPCIFPDLQAFSMGRISKKRYGKIQKVICQLSEIVCCQIAFYPRTLLWNGIVIGWPFTFLSS
jgi:hypothetical protein